MIGAQVYPPQMPKSQRQRYKRSQHSPFYITHITWIGLAVMIGDLRQTTHGYRVQLVFCFRLQVTQPGFELALDFLYKSALQLT
ncbi:hypothetical protein [Moorena sp. SIO3F7]|uniref:hypothetical protein n=1 Tax=Moorena sp. SIO3F7 TaxID=2607839 RepID=UPI0025D16748|nr:hypothetical protein [Moorena sp. SIO3F7]